MKITDKFIDELSSKTFDIDIRLEGLKQLRNKSSLEAAKEFYLNQYMDEKFLNKNVESLNDVPKELFDDFEEFCLLQLAIIRNILLILNKKDIEATGGTLNFKMDDERVLRDLRAWCVKLAESNIEMKVIGIGVVGKLIDYCNEAIEIWHKNEEQFKKHFIVSDRFLKSCLGCVLFFKAVIKIINLDPPAYTPKDNEAHS